MIAPITQVAAPVVLLLLAGCADGLSFAEQTSLNLASVRLNEDPAQPVAVKLGFDRDVVLVAPPIGGIIVEPDGQGGQRTTASGEAVSQFSTFTISSSAPFLSDGQADSDIEPTADLLGVQTRFASGGAALAIADEPEVVAVFLGLSGNLVTKEMLGPEATQRRNAMYVAIDALDDRKARALALEPPTPMDQSMENVVSRVDPNNQRGVNEVTARQVLQAWVPALPTSSYAEWESALGIQ